MVKEEDSEPEQLRKLFIGGLDFRTTDESLRTFFEQFGEIVDVVVMKDPKTKRSRGFGFVAFSNAYMVDDAQKARPHKIDGRVVDTKRAVPREEISKPEAEVTVKKLFVGGLRLEVTEEDLVNEFSEFGEIVAVSIPTEKETQKKRGFAFIEFEDHDAVDKACVKKDIMIHNKRVDVKKALSRSEMLSQGGGGGRNMGGGGPWGMGGGGGGSGGGGGGGNWGGNQNGDDRSGWGNQGGYANQGSYGNQGYSQGPWQGNGSQSWGGNQGAQGWGGQQTGYGTPQGWGASQNAAGGGFGGNYGQSYGGGPVRGQGYGQTSRSTPYNTGGGAEATAGGGSQMGAGYNSGSGASGYGMSGSSSSGGYGSSSSSGGGGRRTY